MPFGTILCCCGWGSAVVPVPNPGLLLAVSGLAHIGTICEVNSMVPVWRMWYPVLWQAAVAVMLE